MQLHTDCAPGKLNGALRCVPAQLWVSIGTVCTPDTKPAQFRAWASKTFDSSLCEQSTRVDRVFILSGTEQPYSEAGTCGEWRGMLWLGYDQPDQELYINDSGSQYVGDTRCVPSGMTANDNSHIFNFPSAKSDEPALYFEDALGDPLLDICP